MVGSGFCLHAKLWQTWLNIKAIAGYPVSMSHHVKLHASCDIRTGEKVDMVLFWSQLILLKYK